MNNKIILIKKWIHMYYGEKYRNEENNIVAANSIAIKE